MNPMLSILLQGKSEATKGSLKFEIDGKKLTVFFNDHFESKIVIIESVSNPRLLKRNNVESL